MNFDFLFYDELPKGVKSVYVNGRRMSMEEFKEVKKRHLSKKAKRVES